MTVLVVVPSGALFGLLMPVLEYGVFPRIEPPPANWDSPGELAKMVPVGIWLVVVPWTAIYFEGVNTRYRAVDGGRASAKTPGFGLAVAALVLSTLFLAPAAVVVAAVAWWRISATGTRYARGSATVATASVGAVVAAGIVAVLVGWPSSSSTSDAGKPVPTTATSAGSGLKPDRPAPTVFSSGLKRIVVRDLSIAVPADWQPLESDVEGTTTMADPAGTAMLVCMQMEALTGMSATELGKSFSDGLRDDKDFSSVQERLVVLPSGIRAYEVRYDLDSDGETVAGVQYTLAVGSNSGKRLYLVTYQTNGSKPENIAEVRESVRSIQTT